MKYCLVMPHFNHSKAFAAFLPRLVPILLELSLQVIIVDDGSNPENQLELQTLLADTSHFILLRHKKNRGKGAAFFTGCYYARAQGYSHVLQIDADGQHDIQDIKKLIQYSQAHPETVVSGKPCFGPDAPRVRVYGRRVTDVWTVLETLSFQIKDALCGFRVYPLSQVEAILDRFHVGVRMDFDTDILVKAVWLDIPLHFVETFVQYPENQISHFKYLRDNLLLVKLHIRLLLGMLPRSPALLVRRLMAVF